VGYSQLKAVEGFAVVAARTLTEEQRTTLLEWLAADFPTSGIKDQFRALGWPVPTDPMLRYYRKTYLPEIMAIRTARRESALTRGLALKEERVAALVAHAEALGSIKWVPDDKGRLHNEKAWRETLRQIAEETGQLVQRTELTGANGAPLIREVVVALPTESVAP
jgi:hypothetical protein